MDLSPEGKGLRQAPRPPFSKLRFLLFHASPMQPLLKQKEEGGLEGEPGQPLCSFLPSPPPRRDLGEGLGVLRGAREAPLASPPAEMGTSLAEPRRCPLKIRHEGRRGERGDPACLAGGRAGGAWRVAGQQKPRGGVAGGQRDQSPPLSDPPGPQPPASASTGGCIPGLPVCNWGHPSWYLVSFLPYQQLAVKRRLNGQNVIFPQTKRE